MKKKLSHKVIQNQHTNTLVKENIIQLTHCIRCKIVLKCQRITKKVAKNTSMAKPLSIKNASQSLIISWIDIKF